MIRLQGVLALPTWGATRRALSVQGGRSLVMGVLTAVLVGGVGALVAAAPTEIGQPPLVDVWMQLLVVLFGGLLVGLLRAPIGQGWKEEGAVALLSLFLCTVVLVALKNTVYGLNGVVEDQGLYTAYITKFAAFESNGDVIYKGLPAFYPPLYYALLGRAAAWLGVAPYHMVKYGLLVTVFLVPFVSWSLWRRLVPSAVAVGLAFTVLLFHEWYKSAEWLALVLFVPWWLAWVMQAGDTHSRARGWVWYGLGALVGALIFMMYYYWFFIGGVALLLALGVGQLPLRSQRGQGATLGVALLLLGGAALLSVGYWGPYLWSMYTTGGWLPLQNRWFYADKLDLPLPFAKESLRGWLWAGGLVYLVLRAGQDRVAGGLLGLLGGVYGWLILGYVGILTDRPLLTFKAFPVPEFLLSLGVVLGLARWGLAWREGRGSPGPEPGTPLAPDQPWRLAPEGWARLTRGRMVPLVLGLLLLASAEETARRFANQSAVAQALETEYPAAMLAAFDGLTDHAAPGRVLLSDMVDVVLYRPVYLFISWHAYYSHPAARFHDRVDFLEHLALTSDPTLFAAAWMHNRYDAIDYTLLGWDGAGWRLTLRDDNFPHKTRTRSIGFSPSLFAQPFFEPRTQDGYTLFATRFDADPLQALAGVSVATAPLNTVARLYALRGTFGDALRQDLTLPAQEALAARLGMADLNSLPVEVLLDLQLAATGELETQAQAALVAGLPSPQHSTFVDETGTAKLEVLGYERGTPDTEGVTTLDIYFRVLTPFPVRGRDARDLSLWVQRPQERARVDVPLPVPSAAWQPGKIYRQQIRLPLVDEGLTVGFWRGEKEAGLVLANGQAGVTLGE